MKVLLLGDSCEDEYIYGRCTRISPEAPVPILDYAKITKNVAIIGMIKKIELWSPKHLSEDSIISDEDFEDIANEIKF